MVISDSQSAVEAATQSNLQAHHLVREGMLSRELDLAALAGQFAADGVLQVRQALRPEVADLLHDCLDRQVPWSLAYRDESGPRKLWSEELATIDRSGREALDEQIYAIARQQFQFRYDSFMMVTAYKEKRHPELVLHRVIEQINSREWLDAFRCITGFPQIQRADAQATRYVPGHFLRRHNDLNEDDGRLCAYVINLSHNWQADWGGLLQILDREGQVVRTLMPNFNSISLFRVPTEHCVSPVAPFATGARYAITGWFRT
jgi:SM-20-related protein